MGRRAHHEGTIYQDAEGYWVGQISLGKDTNGKRIRKTIRGESKADVKEKLDALKVAARAGTITALSNQTLTEMLNRWLDTAVRTTKKPNTYYSYQDVITRLVIPHLGALKLSEINAQHVWKWLAALETAGTKAPTRKYVFVVLNVAFNQAVSDGLLAANPMPKGARPKVEEKEMRYWTPEQAVAFLEAVKKDTPVLYPLFLLALHTGARQGELLALKYEDFDFVEGTVKVRRNLVEPTAGEHRGEILGVFEGKSKNSKRVVSLPPDVVEVVRRHRIEQTEAHGMKPFLFLTKNGTHYLKAHLRRVQKRCTRLANVPTIRFHDLRHTSITMALASGADIKTVSVRSGHAKSSFTLDRYGHVLPNQDRAAADGVAGMLTNAKANGGER